MTEDCYYCVFYDGGDCGYGESCNLDCEVFMKGIPCRYRRNATEMRAMLEADDVS
jgi:hypothetical protein